MVPLPDPEGTCQNILSFIREEVRKAGAKGVVLGLSGGLDSSTAAYLCVKALGNRRVLGLLMPDEVTTREDLEDAKLVAKTLCIPHKLFDLTSLCHQIFPFFRGNRNAKGNVKARLRMVLLYYAANSKNLLVVGTSDRSELLMGYFTKYGDGGADLLPLGGLFKTQVRELARYLGVPARIVDKPSSPGLWPGQRAEEELGISYELLDSILHLKLDLGRDLSLIRKETGAKRELIERVLKRIERTEHKRRFPPIPPPLA
ncbi:MAG: NAD(+) synthetase [Hadesarchaea archaeon]|nr:MAG: NAD(+) synthetase [Hadesarchaea archaeon]TDA35966.1 MAG: NAD(+) synthetase [Hadesarchaea archaeon]